MLNKMISSDEMNTTFMFQYTVLLRYCKVQYAVLIETIQYFSTSIKSVRLSRHCCLIVRQQFVLGINWSIFL